MTKKKHKPTKKHIKLFCDTWNKTIKHEKTDDTKSNTVVFEQFSTKEV